MIRKTIATFRLLLVTFLLLSAVGPFPTSAESAQLVSFSFSSAQITDNNLSATLLNIPNQKGDITTLGPDLKPDVFLRVFDANDKPISRVQIQKEGQPATDGQLSVNLSLAELKITAYGKYALMAEAVINQKPVSSKSITVAYEKQSYSYPTFELQPTNTGILAAVGKMEAQNTYFIVARSGDTIVSRIQAKEGDNALNLNPGTYQVVLEIPSGNYSEAKMVVVPDPQQAKTQAPEVIQSQPTVLANGTFMFTLPSGSPYAAWTLTVEVLNDNDTVLYTQALKDKSKTLRDAQLAPGTYKVRVKAVQPSSGITTYSLPTVWTISPVTKIPDTKVPDNNKPTTGDMKVPGTITVNDGGTITVQIDRSGNNAKFSYVLIVNDLNGTTLKTVPLYGVKATYSLKRLNLPEGNYVLFVKMINKQKQTTTFVLSEPVPWNTEVHNGVIESNNFPGGIAPSTGGLLRVVIQPGIYYPSYQFYVVILNGKGEEVQRMPVEPRNYDVSLDQLKLAEGIYKVKIIMIYPASGIVYSSAMIPWIVVNGENEAATFPGSYVIKPDGSISVRIRTDGVFANFKYTLIVLDKRRSPLKRIPITVDNTTVSPSDINLPDGAYSVCLNMTDPVTDQNVHSEEETLAVNNSGSTAIIIDGLTQKYDTKPVIVDGSTLVPMRAIFESFGAKVDWDTPTQTVTAVKDDLRIKLTISSKIAWVQEDRNDLEVPAQLIDSKTMVPIRFVSEALGADVGWDARTQSIIIQK